jgi:hypothetical protein
MVAASEFSLIILTKLFALLGKTDFTDATGDPGEHMTGKMGNPDAGQDKKAHVARQMPQVAFQVRLYPPERHSVTPFSMPRSQTGDKPRDGPEHCGSDT